MYAGYILNAALAKMAMAVCNLVARTPCAHQHDAFQLILFAIIDFFRPLLL